MSLSAVTVRPATLEDLPALLAFGKELREQLLPVDGGKRGRPSALASRPVLEGRYLEALADPDRHLVVAVNERGEALGMALLVVASANALLDMPAVHVSHALVLDRFRRRGAGKALVAAAASFAEEHGLDQLVVSVHPSSREANRFYARLGFAPLAVRRVAPVSVVRRMLASGEPRSVEQAVRRRPRRPARLRVGALGRLGPADPEPALPAD